LKPVRIPQQLIPLAILLFVGVAALVIARQLLVPETFGTYGHYRAGAVDEIMALEVVYAGSDACIDCHDDMYALKQESNHRGLSCEVCHGPAVKHVEAPDEYSPIVPRTRDHCALCHGYNPSRPTGFPQIIEKLHNPGQPCMSCHSPHNPELPHSPEECKACHRRIAGEKTVSHHATLHCTTCHMTPDEHLVIPASVRSQKPETNNVCAGCHAEDADSPRHIPRIDPETHADRYFCWDCHYPHSPEAGR